MSIPPATVDQRRRPGSPLGVDGASAVGASGSGAGASALTARRRAAGAPVGSAAKATVAHPTLVSVGVALTLLVIWQGLTSFHVVSATTLPSPERVVQDFVRSATVGYGGATLLAQTEISLFRILAGFVAAVVVGVAIGLGMAVSRTLHAAIDPLLQFLRPVPPLAFIPLLVMWFGIGEAPKILLIFFCTIPIVILNTVSGVAATPPGRVRAAQCLGARNSQLFRRVILPSALPEVFTGMRVGLGIAWTCLVAAEMVAASRGLGWMVLRAGNNLQAGVVFVVIVTIGILGYLMDLGLRLLERWLVPWKGKA